MTNLEKEALKSCADRIKLLASLERAKFNGNDEKDAEIKKAIKPYMMWFESVSYSLEKIIELADDKGEIKKLELNEIIRLNL